MLSLDKSQHLRQSAFTDICNRRHTHIYIYIHTANIVYDFICMIVSYWSYAYVMTCECDIKTMQCNIFVVQLTRFSSFWKFICTKSIQSWQNCRYDKFIIYHVQIDILLLTDCILYHIPIVLFPISLIFRKCKNRGNSFLRIC